MQSVASRRRRHLAAQGAGASVGLASTIASPVIAAQPITRREVRCATQAVYADRRRADRGRPPQAAVVATAARTPCAVRCPYCCPPSAPCRCCPRANPNRRLHRPAATTNAPTPTRAGSNRTCAFSPTICWKAARPARAGSIWPRCTSPPASARSVCGRPAITAAISSRCRCCARSASTTAAA
ncbi:hypothetical protein [Lysobacter gummosus]|uniref:hypothetical protein n=1 Tax=Lysobacter gummosus TaxID=262324 RepID=UPI00363F43CD